MWSQPDIVRLNAQAKEHKADYRETLRLGFTPVFKQRLDATQLTLDGGAEPLIQNFIKTHPEYADKPYAYSDGILTLGEPLECACEGYGGEECSSEQTNYLWYDIFSDDPKGVLTVCENHEGYGSPAEGYFTCDDCGKVFIDNYTWEVYHTQTDDGIVCLPCAAKRYIANPDNWIDLTGEITVTQEQIRSAQHVIGVDMPVPKGIKFGDNAEFDSMTGHQISGGPIADILQTAKDEGHTRALLILDAAYQFAVSVGVYVEDK